MALVGQSRARPSRARSSRAGRPGSRMLAGPRHSLAYGSGRAGQRVVTTPLRRPRSTHGLTVSPLSQRLSPGLSPGHPRDREAEAGLNEREIGEDVPGENLVEQNQVVERRRAGVAPGDAAAGDRDVVEHLALRCLRPAARPAAGHLAGRAERAAASGLAELADGLAQQVERLAQLIPAQPEPGQGVTTRVLMQVTKAQCRVTVIGPGAARVIAESGLLADRAQGAVLAGPLGAQRAGAAQPVE